MAAWILVLQSVLVTPKDFKSFKGYDTLLLPSFTVCAEVKAALKKRGVKAICMEVGRK